MVMRTLKLIASIVGLCLLFVACTKEPAVVRQPDLPASPIVILYESDVHCSVDGYPKLVSLRDQCLDDTEYLSVVSCGDFASGGNVGALSKGEKIVEIMNQVGYDVVALGNHELDYGMQQMFRLVEAMNAPMVCANLKNVQTNEHPFAPYHIVSYGDVDVAYIGFTTTTSGTVTGLADENGAPLYSFMREEFYELAQRRIDEARSKGADFVVALSHLGDTANSDEHPSSVELIGRTVGLDAVIDGHDHHVIECRMVANRDSKDVLLTAPGTNFNYIGKLVIASDGTISSSLADVSSLEADETMKQFVDNIKDEIGNAGDFIIGRSDVNLTIYDAEGKRIVRTHETNLGDFCTDALRMFTGADIAMVNGGGIRADIKSGDIRFNDLYNVMPFDDRIATGTISGEKLLDVLEFAVSSLPNEAGVFMQVSGLRYVVNPDVVSPVVRDADELFSYVGEGERRVSNVEILDGESGEYKPVDLSKQYTIATLDYLILERGGDAIFDCVEPVIDNWGADIEVLHHYIESTLGGVVGAEYSEPQGRIIYK